MGCTKLAPLGYLNRHDKSRSWIEVDPKLGSMISQAFKEIATRKWTLDKWTQRAYSLGYRTKSGKRIYKSAWRTILHNRFYIGETCVRSGDSPVKSSHESLVDEATFSIVQEVLRTHDKNEQTKYLLQGLAHPLVDDKSWLAKTNPNKNINYYHGRAKVNGSQNYYNNENIETQLLDLIRNITITDDNIRQELRNDLRQWFNKELEGNKEYKQAETKLIKLIGIDDSAEQLLFEEEVSNADFEEYNSKVVSERSKLQNLFDVGSHRKHLIKVDFGVAIQFATDIGFLFEKGNFDEKRLLLEILFKRVCLKDGKVSEVELNTPFGLVVYKSNSSWPSTSKDTSKLIAVTINIQSGLKSPIQKAAWRRVWATLISEAKP